ncbi:class 3 adenylate cyclase [Pseudomonas sp. BIGb0450]|uniref:adenylate/guanylate cyclase domain-containing protein n=1 Tax=unclassified Pseudomonas TaxID=196821 RepID=UPI00216851B9|nr:MULTISPECIES: adenylate/guanylate cyclase domain-containing protein [unclassified Pseudomonas]MCS3419638.1 class 3 adenylate cyclase [Pseudomonas sp. BIGb0558]MCS3439206.1 class 3 adenylate cyclase [Pseudomonas sp. BIGb0450]
MESNILTERGFDAIFNSTLKKREKLKGEAHLKSSMGLESHDAILAEATNRDIAESLEIGPQGEYVIQGAIRKWFDKLGVNEGAIAAHPDFKNMPITGETINQYVCTVFIDIKGSTRLSLLYDLEFIYNFKNAVLKACIDIVRSFDGYVHRLMGDALMAFFGSSLVGKEQAAIDAINCSIMFKVVLEYSIKPWLEKHKGFDAENFGFRVGCNFGDDLEVLWGNYGYGYLGEVSPTGLPVDLAAKLQGLASKNEIMLGQGIMNFINWPEEFSKIKIVQKNGVDMAQEFVTPNYKKPDGTDLNYGMRILNYQKCIDYLPIDVDVKSRLKGGRSIDNPLISYRCDAGTCTENMTNYVSASRFLDKNMSLRFIVEANSISRLKFPLSVKFTKKNHGPDVPLDELVEVPVTECIRRSGSGPFFSCELIEGTSYRGIHTMECEVRESDNTLIYRNKIAVLIK